MLFSQPLSIAVISSLSRVLVRVYILVIYIPERFFQSQTRVSFIIRRVPYLGVFHRDTMASFSSATALAMVAIPVANGPASRPYLFEQRFICRWSTNLTSDYASQKWEAAALDTSIYCISGDDSHKLCLSGLIMAFKSCLNSFVQRASSTHTMCCMYR